MSGHNSNNGRTRPFESGNKPNYLCSRHDGHIKTTGSRCRLKALLVVIFALCLAGDLFELLNNNNCLPLSAVIRSCSASELSHSAQTTSGPLNSSLPSPANQSGNHTTMTTTTMINDSTRHLHLHQLNVLCNSKCNCVLLTSRSSPPPGGEQSKPDNNETTSVAFGEDYSIDEDDNVINNDDDQININDRATTRSPASQRTEVNATTLMGNPVSAKANNSNSQNSLETQQQQHQHLSKLINNNGKQTGSAAFGRDLNQQQLYASQAPKLSLHAHQQQALPGLLHAEPPPPAAYNPFPHSIRSNYLAHHMRSKQSSGAATANSSSTGTSNIGGASSRQLPMPANFADLNQQQQIKPLKALNLSREFSQFSANFSGQPDSVSGEQANATRELVVLIEKMLASIDDNDQQSLILQHNNLQFDLWSDLYATLAIHFRLNLYHLDLSHNSLVKLGVTFTGYLEHHLASHNNSWPIKANNYNTSTTEQTNPNDLSPLGNSYKSSKMSTSVSSTSSAKLKHTLLSGGKIYSAIQRRHQLRNNQTQKSKHILQQPMLLRALDLSHNKLKWLINDQFRMLKHLQTLRLDHNEIKYIHQHAFSGLEALRFLNLNFNKLQVIYIEQFQNNYNLLALMVRSNLLAYLRGGSFASLSNLKRLDLSKNKLTIMSSNAFIGLESLELLNCSSNQFVHAPSASLHSLTSLRQLDLSDNLISQLAPGTFFHMPIEELSLNQNEQLVSIDRGAFWDLPYLKRLDLKSNSMLMNINSQAFVGTQNLQYINVKGCQSLDLNTKQMLENITMAATSRLLRIEQQIATSGPVKQAADYQQQQQVVGLLLATNNSQSSNNSTLAGQMSTLSSSKLLASNLLQLHPEIQSQLEQQNKLNYAYYLGTMALLVVALKIVFEYTSSNHYLRHRRSRRRVYEKSSDDCSLSTCHDNQFKQVAAAIDLNSDSISDSLESGINQQSGDAAAADGRPTEAYEMCDMVSHQQQQTEGDVIFAHGTGSEGEINCGVGGLEELSAEFVEGSHQEVASWCENPENQQDQQDVFEEIALDEQDVMNESAMSSYCPDCPLGLDAGDTEHQAAAVSQQMMAGEPQQQQQQQQPSSMNYDLFQRQLVAAGLDYGHANCAHFYQSLGPALQFADMTANFMHHDHFYS